jgi:two-component system chemotaxis response regulator CheY
MSGRSCLVVDDSGIVRRVATEILDDLGFDCRQAGDGQDALSKCKQSMPDVVLLDWNMPVMDGLEFLKALRNLPDGSQPTVIFCTTENDIEKIQQALSAGADEYIMKPFDHDLLSGKLAQLNLI